MLIFSIFDNVESISDTGIVPVYDFRHACVMWDETSLDVYLRVGLGMAEEEIPTGQGELLRKLMPVVDKMKQSRDVSFVSVRTRESRSERMDFRASSR